MLRWKRWMKAGKSRKWSDDEIQRGPSIETFIGDDLMTANFELSPAREKTSWRGAQLRERLQHLVKGLFIFHPDLVAVLQEIKRRYERARESGRAMALLVVVHSGGGKSHLIRLLHRLMPDQDTPAQVFRYVVSFSIPARPTPAEMTRELLKAMGDPGWETGHVNDALDRAVDILKRLGVKVVAIDNVQDIPERRGRKGVQLLGNWIRDLWDKADCLILLLGTPAALEIVRANEQLRRRNPAKMTIPYFSISDAGAHSRYKRFLQKVDEALPLAECSRLEDHAKPLYWATFGNPEYIFALLAEAIGIATAAGREMLIRDDLATAFERHYKESGAGINPFCDGGPDRLLDRLGEPFFEWQNVLRPKAVASGVGKIAPGVQ